MDIVVQEFSRFWQDLVSRPEGPFALRFVMQPIVSTLLAVRDGMQDARTGRDPYLGFILRTSPDKRRAALKEGAKATGRVLLLGLLLDLLYQLKTFGGFRYPGESLAIAFTLGFLPYLIVRGPARRITAALMARNSAGNSVDKGDA